MRQGQRFRWIAAGCVLGLATTLLASMPATAMLNAAAMLYDVYNAKDGLSSGSEILVITPNGKYALLVGANDDTSNGIKETKLRSVAIAASTDNTLFTKQSRDLATAIGNLRNTLPSSLPPNGLVNPVASSVAMHPTEGYALVSVREYDKAVIEAGNERAGGVVQVEVDQEDGSMTEPPANSALPVGIHPNSIAIAPNGQYAVVVNSDPDAGSGDPPDRPGTISVIDLRPGLRFFTVIATIQPVLPASTDSRPIRNQADPQPETVIISSDSSRAFVSFRENNAIAIIDMNLAALPARVTAIALPRRMLAPGETGTPDRLFPDGMAITSDGQYLVTANAGASADTPNSISLFRVLSSSQLEYVADSTNTIATAVTAAGLPGVDNSEPSMVALDAVDGALMALVTLRQSNAVAAFWINPTAPTASGRLVFDDIQSLTSDLPNGETDLGQEPEGIATFGSADLWVTANRETQNVSVIKVRRNPNAVPTPAPAPTPDPNTPFRLRLPLLAK